MYTSLSIKNFRAFQTLEVEGLKRVNLFTGRNNSGKTSVLEAVYLLEGSNEALRVLALYEGRGLGSTKMDRFSERTMPWATLFHDLEVEADIELSGTHAGGGAARIALSTNLTPEDRQALPSTSYNPAGILVTRKPHLADRPRDFLLVTGDKIDSLNRSLSLAPRFLLAGKKADPLDLAKYYGDLEIEKAEDSVVEALRIIDGRILDVKTNHSGGPPVMYADTGGRRLLPLAVLGEGAGRLFEIVLEMRRGQGGPVLIDEIENGFHYSVLPEVWKLIHALAKEHDVQVFAVTHSEECAVAAHEAAVESGDYDFQYYRVERKNGIGSAVAYTRDQMQTSIEYELEFR